MTTNKCCSTCPVLNRWHLGSVSEVSAQRVAHLQVIVLPTTERRCRLRRHPTNPESTEGATKWLAWQAALTPGLGLLEGPGEGHAGPKTPVRNGRGISKALNP